MDFAGRRVTVMGLGRFGGGLGVTRWLASRGADVLVTDLDPAEKLTESVAALRDLIDGGAVTLRLGGHNVSDFTTCDVVIANPAVPKPWENRFLRAAEAAGITVTTEMGLLVERLPSRERVIGVTGTAGKSTTSALTAHILKTGGQPVLLGGNIGGSLLSEAIDPRTWVVLELSSFMLHWLRGWSPHIAVVTNIAPNHLDWHGTFEHYGAAKRTILASQREGDVAVLGPGLRDTRPRAGVRRVDISPDVSVGPLAIPGKHNQVNAACAIAAVTGGGTAGLSVQEAVSAATTFAGLPHRLQLVAERAGVRYFNDSKSTTPESTLLALDAFAGAGGGVHLIAGGYDKGADLTPIARASHELAGLYTIGATGDTLAAAAERFNSFRCGTLDRAVAEASSRAKEGDVVLLSPACASWDQFTNYEKRGERFVQLVNGIGVRA